MKNLIYILIFLPSLLFSQETKNMELVGVRNIQLSDELPSFTVDSGIIFKVQSWSLDNLSTNPSIVSYISLNSEYIYYRRDYGGAVLFESPTPFYLSSGIHSVDHYENNFNITLYGLEFKLTTQ
jgi:hypothetical protein